MIHLEGYSTEEAAELLGWSSVTVRVRAFRSRKKLRKLLSKMLEGEDASE
jgi:DNA-directed RNA polymerase specialized sigma24 family protein